MTGLIQIRICFETYIKKYKGSHTQVSEKVTVAVIPASVLIEELAYVNIREAP